MKRWVWGACLVGLLITAKGHAALIDPATATFQWDPPAPPAPVSTCVTSAATWQNVALTAQTGAFTVEFDATPNNAAMDGVIGLSNGPAAGYTSLAAIVRFNSAGLIDAVNGGAYAAGAVIPYIPGTTYHVRLVTNLPTHTYDIYVRSLVGVEQLLASNFAFRTEQAAVATLNNLSAYAGIGSEAVCILVASPPDVNVATSYNLKCGPASGSYTVVYAVALPYAPVPIKNVVSAPGTYFCIVTGVNLAGESNPSNEVTFQIAASAHPPAAPVLRIMP